MVHHDEDLARCNVKRDIANTHDMAGLLLEFLAREVGVAAAHD
jgi:hypothetical protein